MSVGRAACYAMVSRRDKDCLCASGAEVAEPAQRATELARGAEACSMQGHRGRRLSYSNDERGATTGEGALLRHVFDRTTFYTMNFEL